MKRIFAAVVGLLCLLIALGAFLVTQPARANADPQAIPAAPQRRSSLPRPRMRPIWAWSSPP